MFEQTTSLDYNIKSSFPNNCFTNNIEVIRGKNSANFQTKLPMKEVRFIINFSPNEIARIEIKNNGSPSIEINFGSSNDDKNETFTFLPKKSLFMMSSKEASILQKEYSFKCPDQEFIRNKKFNFMEIILYNAFHESNPCQLGLCYFIVFIKKEDSAKPSTPKNFLIENKLLLKGAGAAANFEKNTNFKKERFEKLTTQLKTEPKKSEFINKFLNKGEQTEKFNYLKQDYDNNNLDLEITPHKNVNKPPIFIQKKLNFDYNLKQKSNHDDKFEEDLKKALEESKKTYENYQTEKIYGKSNMEFEFEEEEIVIEKSKEDIYKEYKKMIYGDEQDIRPSLEENSMFPLRYDDLDPTYIKLEKIAKN